MKLSHLCAGFAVSAIFTFSNFVHAKLEFSVEVDANNRHETVVSIKSLARYSLQVKSDQGVALQYVDRMYGPSIVSGRPGNRDGRIDTILNISEYKLVALAANNGSGTAKISVHSFEEKNTGDPVLLVEKKLESTQLSDLQQRSYWVTISNSQSVNIEAAGRFLSDVQLWKDGNWLVESKAVKSTIEPSPGQPLNLLQLSTSLTAGTYKVVFYGGKGVTWAEQSENHPLYLRRGFSTLSANAREFKVTSPFGYDYWLVPGKTDYFRLELPKSEDAEISVSNFNKSRPFRLSGGRNASIRKDSRLPVAEVNRSGSSNPHLVKITREAGKPYVFQRFDQRREAKIDKSGSYWINTFSAGYADDAADLTAMMTTSSCYGCDRKLVQARAIEVDDDKSWRRKFNLMNDTSLFVNVSEGGDYFVSELTGQNIKYRFIPFFTNRPSNYKTPRYRNVGESWELNRGIYQLELSTAEYRGTVDLTIFADGSIFSLGAIPPENYSPRINALFQEVPNAGNSDKIIYLRSDNRLPTGLDVRKLPIHLGENLSTQIPAKASLKIPVRVPKKGWLSITTDSGTQLPFKIGTGRSILSSSDTGSTSDSNAGSPAGIGLMVNAGKFNIDVSNPTEHTVEVNIEWVSAESLGPLPVIDRSRLPKEPDFEVLTASDPLYFTMGRRSRKTVNIDVIEPGLYRVESTGLLSTTGTIRAKTITRLDSQSQNGTGRNFLIQKYLREGQYQLTMTTDNSSKGHLGIRLKNTSLIHGGVIYPEFPARSTLESGAAQKYQLHVETAGRYQVSSMGLQRKFRVRLEDIDGWPLVKPGTTSGFNHYFEPGDYQLIVLPETLTAKVVTSLNLIQPEITREGHGPFELPFNQKVNHQWLEPEKDAERIPDVWDFNLSASANVLLTLSKQMQGMLYKNNQFETPVAKFDFRKPLKMSLEKASYQLQVTSSRKDNRFDYQLAFSTEEMVPGQQYEFAEIGRFPLSISDRSIIQIRSFGNNRDLKARLYNFDNQLLAANDDSVNDWNFNLVETLNPGKYWLEIRSSSGYGSFNVSIDQPVSTRDVSLVPGKKVIQTDSQIHSYDLNVSGGPSVLAVSALSADPVSLILEQLKTGESEWRQIAGDLNKRSNVFAVYNSNTKYRIKVWSTEQRQAEIEIETLLLPFTTVSSLEGVKATTWQKKQILGKSFSSLHLKSDQPSSYTQSGAGADIWWTNSTQPALTQKTAIINSGSQTDIWLVNAESKNPVKLQTTTLSTKNTDKKPQSVVVSKDELVAISLKGLANVNESILIQANSRLDAPVLSLPQRDTEKSQHNGLATDSSVVLINQPIPEYLLIDSQNFITEQTAVQLTALRIKEQPGKSLKTGWSDISLPPKSKTIARLAGNIKDLKFSLPRGVYAELTKRGQNLQGFWSGDKHSQIEVVTEADAIILVNSLSDRQTIHVENSKTRLENKLELTDFIDRNNIGSGTFVLPVVSNQYPARISAAGHNLRLRAITHSGQVSQSDYGDNPTLEITEPARLFVSHESGYFALWLSGNQIPSSQNIVEIGDYETDIKLSGSTFSQSMTVSRAGFYLLRSSSPMLLQGSFTDGKLYPNGISELIFIPAGNQLINISALNGMSFNDYVSISLVTSSQLSEGLGVISRLTAGSSVTYQFSLIKNQQIGLGVKADPDKANALLFNEFGELLGTGITQLHDLKAGVYFFKITAPETGGILNVQPAIAGLQTPGMTPSASVIKKYQQLINQ